MLPAMKPTLPLHSLESFHGFTLVLNYHLPLSDKTELQCTSVQNSTLAHHEHLLLHKVNSLVKQPGEGHEQMVFAADPEA